MEGKYDLYSENGFNISKKDASRNYADCKKYVNEQNYKLLNTPGEIADTRVESVEIYKQVINYGAKLEEKYIPLEEREQISEDVKSY